MTNYYFKQETIKHSKKYGYQVRECSIYLLDEKDMHPIKIGTCQYNTGSTCGATNEVFAFLVKQGRMVNIKAPIYGTGTTIYFSDSVANELNNIYELY